MVASSCSDRAMARGFAMGRWRSRRCISQSISVVRLILIPMALYWCAASSFTAGAPGLSRRRARALHVARGGVPAGVDLRTLRKRELIELLGQYGEDAGGMGKMDLLARLSALQEEPSHAEISTADLPDQREVAETAMDDWQNATTFGFDCKRAHLVDNGIKFDIVGPSGSVDHTVHFSPAWPPSCTCADAQRWGSQRRCKHVCMLLVKCGVPYAAVSDSSWKPEEMEVRSIVEHMRGRWSPIPVTDE
eukprot:gb/GFBE01041124.1/.p1 GENE.gb/GFBE01041124.1/~~gb/GFBE01041124.1/.p1  ORF type:complete len:248 (+),score=37.01 gb/GFBE01041124.1/:1-744(+)